MDGEMDGWEKEYALLSTVFCSFLWVLSLGWIDLEDSLSSDKARILILEYAPLSVSKT